jgi:hypothetical protein
LKPELPAALRPGHKHKPKASLPRNSSTPVLLTCPTKHTDPVEIVHCKVFSQIGFFESAFLVDLQKLLSGFIRGLDVPWLHTRNQQQLTRVKKQAVSPTKVHRPG